MPRPSSNPEHLLGLFNLLEIREIVGTTAEHTDGKRYSRLTGVKLVEY
jgi:hypothetical protein